MKSLEELEEVTEEFENSLVKINKLSDKIEEAGENILNTENKVKELLTIKNTVNQLYEETQEALKGYKEFLKTFQDDAIKREKKLSEHLEALEDKVEKLTYQINSMTGKFEEKLSSLHQEIHNNFETLANKVTEIRQTLIEVNEKSYNGINEQLNDLKSRLLETEKKNKVFNILESVFILIIIVLIILFNI